MLRTLSLMIISVGWIGLTSLGVYGQYLIKFPIVQADMLQADGGPDHQAGLGAVVQMGAVVPAIGGTPPYLYSWSPGTGLNDSTISNPLLTVDATRTYTFTVTDADSCTASVQVLVEMLIGVINVDHTNARWNAFPNPVHGRSVWIQWTEYPGENYQYSLFSMAGTQVWCGMAHGVSHRLNFEDSGLKSGVYTLCVVVDGETSFRKLILL